MNDRIVGICRFSFLGLGDWIGMRGGGDASPERIAHQAAQIYAPDRLERRFAAFETLFLPWVAAQTDPDFELWILTSPELPAPDMARLRDLCAPLPQIRIIVSAERDCKAALAEPLMQVAQAAGGPVMQFRIDDDDALSRHYIARLRAHMRRFQDMRTVAISMACGLILRSYGDEPVSFWRAKQLFGSAGAAVRMADRSRSVFSRNHFDLPRHFPAFSDIEGLNYVQLRWDAGDSAAPAQMNWDSRHVALALAHFEALIEDDFPFLKNADFGFMTGA